MIFIVFANLFEHNPIFQKLALRSLHGVINVEASSDLRPLGYSDHSVYKYILIANEPLILFVYLVWFVYTQSFPHCKKKLELLLKAVLSILLEKPEYT